MTGRGSGVVTYAAVAALLVMGCTIAPVARTPASVVSSPTAAAPSPTVRGTTATTPAGPPPTQKPTPGPTIEPDPEPTLEPTPEPTLGPTPEPIPEPTPEATSPPIGYRPGPIQVDGFAEVLVTDLVVREKPFVGPASVITQVHPNPGEILFLMAGPVEGSGYDWYQVASGSAAVLGWIAAASHAGEPWIAGRTPVCPTDPADLESVLIMTGLERVSCFGSRTITVDLELGGWSDLFGPVYPWGTPHWLNGFGDGVDGSRRGFGTASWIKDLRFSPDSISSKTDESLGEDSWSVRRVTGHFDDPAAATCRGGEVDASGDGEAIQTENPVEGEILKCRTQFAVTKALGLHRVGAGETLSSIAKALGATLAALLAENPSIGDANRIAIGDLIAIPPTAAP